MKFEDLPKELQNIFLKCYLREKKLNGEQTENHNKIMSLYEEEDELRKQCTNSSGYARTRTRREEISDERYKRHNKELSLCCNLIDVRSKLYDFVKEIWEAENK